MSSTSDSLPQRLGKLGLHCDEVPHDRLTSATVALACFPMYMVANVHAWTADRQWELPLINFPGSESVREAWAIGRQEGELQREDHVEMTREHRRVLGAMLTGAKPADRIIYDYALETLKQFLASATPAVGSHVRAAVARMVVAVAKASGEGWFGSGSPVSDEERRCIEWIASELSLRDSEPAASVLADL